MKHLNRGQLGELLKERRKSLGFKQKQLADDILSPSTISNIENGKRKVSEDTIAHYCRKLGWKLEEIPQYLLEGNKRKEDKTKELELQLRSLEIDIDYGNLKHKLKELKELSIPKNSPHKAVIQYLMGKWYYKNEDLEKAIDHFSESIYIYDKNPKFKYTNMKSASLYEIGRVYHRKNDLDNAIKCVLTGLKSFIENGERKYYKYNLLISKVIYLEKLDKNLEAKETLDTMWPFLAEINTETQLNMFEMQATIYNKLDHFEKALKYAETGIDIARREKNYDRCFELWTTLGVSYKNLGKPKLAETCFKTASHFEKKLRKKYLLPAYNYTELGKLYMEQQKTELAENILRDAVKLGKKAKDGLRYYEALVALGDCLMKQNKEVGLYFLEEALKLVEKFSFVKQERSIVLKLAKYNEKKDLIKHNKYFARFYELSVQLMHGGEEKMPQDINQLAHLTERKTAGDPPDG